jgi:hypothetical protein
VVRLMAGRNNRDVGSTEATSQILGDDAVRSRTSTIDEAIHSGRPGFSTILFPC